MSISFDEFVNDLQIWAFEESNQPEE